MTAVIIAFLISTAYMIGERVEKYPDWTVVVRTRNGYEEIDPGRLSPTEKNLDTLLALTAEDRENIEECIIFEKIQGRRPGLFFYVNRTMQVMAGLQGTINKQTSKAEWSYHLNRDSFDEIVINAHRAYMELSRCFSREYSNDLILLRDDWSAMWADPVSGLMGISPEKNSHA